MSIKWINTGVPLDPRDCIVCGGCSPEKRFTYHFNRSQVCTDCQYTEWLLAEKRPHRNSRILGVQGGHWRTLVSKLEAKFGSGCSICHTRKGTLCVDHIHGTRLVRGLLCHSCNKGLGRFRDDPGLLEKAANYIEKHCVL